MMARCVHASTVGTCVHLQTVEDSADVKDNKSEGVSRSCQMTDFKIRIHDLKNGVGMII